MRNVLMYLLFLAGLAVAADGRDELDELVTAYNSSTAPLDPHEVNRWQRDWRDRLLSAAQGNSSSPSYKVAIRRSSQLSNTLGDIDVSIVLSQELVTLYPEDPMMQTQYASLLFTQYKSKKDPLARDQCLKEIKSSIDILQANIVTSQSKNQFLREQVVINYCLLGDMFNENPNDWKLAADAYHQGYTYAKRESLPGDGRLSGYDAETFLSREMNAAISGGDLARAENTLNELISNLTRLTADYYIVQFSQQALGHDPDRRLDYLYGQLKVLGHPLELGVMLEISMVHMSAQEYQKALPILERIDKEYANVLLERDAHRTVLGLHGTYGTVLINLAHVYSHLEMQEKEIATWSRFVELFPNDPMTVQAKSRIDEIKQQLEYKVGILRNRGDEPLSPLRNGIIWANVVALAGIAISLLIARRLRRNRTVS